MPLDAAHSAEPAQLVIRIARQDCDVPAKATEELKELGEAMYALGHLEALVHHGELPEADHKEVATVIAHDGVLSI